MNLQQQYQSYNKITSTTNDETLGILNNSPYIGQICKNHSYACCNQIYLHDISMQF